MRARDLLLDVWSPLSHKRPMAEQGRGTSVNGLGWLDEASKRRLTAYQMLRAYQDNVARAFLADDGEGGSDEHREYGDAALVVNQTLALLLGDEQTITVEGAQDYAADLPEDATPEELAANEVARARAEREDWLRAWAVDERLPVKQLEAERHAVGLGDGAYLLAWSALKQRTRLRVVDPGFYFPVLGDGLDSDEYPTRVHLAWELPEDPRAGTPRRLRRITYELGPIEPARDVQVGPRGQLSRLLRLNADGDVVLQQGDAYDAAGRIVRRYPWHGPDDQPSAVTCYMTDAEWELDSEVAKADLDTLSMSGARYASNEDGELLDRLDLRLDFLPVIHVPNTVAGAEHFGRSALSDVLQLLDDVSAGDTDTQAASATTGSPPIVLHGANLPKNPDGSTAPVSVGPGEVWEVDKDGGMTQLDTSASLAALREQTADRLERLSVNTRLPAAVLGRITPTAGLAGITLALSFGPAKAKIGEMRLARGEKYPLLLKFAQRIAMAGGQLPAGEVYDANLAFGSYLPNDTAGTVELVTKLRATTPPTISLETAVRMLVEGGVPIDDVAAEVARVEARDYHGANELADATGDQAQVLEYLGMDPAAAPTVVPVIVPPPSA